MQYTLSFTPEAEDTYDSLSSQLMERWGERDGRIVTVICFWDNRQEPLFNI
ncbi:hypothetical protein ACFQRK_04110 [Parapedobacter sp. GCM10030251]|uniref:hypothetical protein n=1 Tax=Parapedobacter sp. GCM10030251 TaxID=3273419 RepID=UPI0036238702